MCILYLINKWSSERVALKKHTGPQLRVFASDQVARQALEEGVFIANLMRKGYKKSDVMIQLGQQNVQQV